MSRCSISAIRSRTIGRSPEILKGHSPDCSPAPRRMVSEDGRKGWPGIQQVAGETLEHAGFAGIDAQMMQLHLSLGPGQGRRPLECESVPMLVDKIEYRFS